MGLPRSRRGVGILITLTHEYLTVSVKATLVGADLLWYVASVVPLLFVKLKILALFVCCPIFLVGGPRTLIAGLDPRTCTNGTTSKRV